MQRFSVLLFVSSKQTRCFEFTSQMAEMAEYRFRAAKTFEQEEKCVASAIPKSTQYKNKWAVGIFEQWQKVRVPKVATLEPGGLFKNYDLHKVQSLEFPLLEMDALSLNYWLAKFIQEVAKPSKERYPPRTIYQIVCGIRRFMEEKNANLDFNLLDASDKRCSSVAFIVIICSHIVIVQLNSRLCLFSCRFSILRRVLDVEMKEGTRLGIGIANKKEEKQPVNEEDERKFWTLGLLGNHQSKSLLNTVYFYNGKLFGLRASEHRSISLNNFEIGDNYIRFEENVSKTFHGGLLDLKYEPRVVRHICHEVGEKHDPCLVDMYRLYVGLVECIGKDMEAFYFRPNAKKFSFDKSPVGVNTLNQILPTMCKAAGLKRKTSHSLRVTCASTLFNAGVDSKLIRDRTGHKSDALLKYEKPEEKVISKVSAILGPKCASQDKNEPNDKVMPIEKEFNLEKDTAFCFGDFNNCNVTFNVNSK